MFDILLVSRDARLIPAISLALKRPGPDPAQQFICREKFDCWLGDCAADDGAELMRETRECQANHAGAIFSASREVPNDYLWAQG